ncbi:MAG: gas vesicle protein GvpG, partial [Comamonadaceae bacterium]
MLILDNLLLSPLLWIFREINESVQKEQAGEAETVTRSLSELYMKLDTGAITEEQFDAEEAVLLDRLDAIQERDQESAEEDEDAEDAEDDEEEDDDDDDDDDDEDED